MSFEDQLRHVLETAPVPDTVCTASQLVSAAAQIADKWSSPCYWRGHARSDWELVPGVFRGSRSKVYEANAVNRFRARAPSRCVTTPPDGPDGMGKWLFLMQHFGLPTRLLDWSESPLVAAYFAVTEHPDAEGALWALDPFKLNKAVGVGDRLVGAMSPPANGLVARAFNRKAPSTPGADVVAIVPDEVDLRLLIQLAGFTIHGTPDPLERRADTAAYLRRITIPAECKKRLTADLELLGMRRSTLFPDLQNLARELADVDFEPVQEGAPAEGKPQAIPSAK